MGEIDEKSSIYINNLQTLRKNIQVVEGSFGEFGLEVTGTGCNFSKFMGGNGAEFFIEVAGNKAFETPEDVQIKVNVYNADNGILASGYEKIKLKGKIYCETYRIVTIGKEVWGSAVKAKVFLSRDNGF